MHVAIVAHFVPGMAGGVEQYTTRLILGLDRYAIDHRFTVLANSSNFDIFCGLKNERIDVQITDDPNLVSVRSWTWRVANRFIRVLPGGKHGLAGVHLAAQIARCNPDIVHFPGNYIYPLYLKTPCLLTFLDMQHQVYPEFFSERELMNRRRLYPASVQKASRVITISEYTRQSLLNESGISPSKIETIHLSFEKPSVSISREEAIEHLRTHYKALPERFIFYPAHTWPHKNHSTLIRAIARLRTDYDYHCNLILTGGGKTAHGDVLSLIQQLSLTDQVMHLGYVDQQTILALYTVADMLVFPSLYEGFGIPIVEAFHFGCPVVSSNAGSLNEVAADAAWLVEPLDVESYALAIYTVATNPELRHQMIQKGLSRAEQFNLKAMVEKTIHAYERAYVDQERCEDNTK